jgi:esterase/lipase
MDKGYISIKSDYEKKPYKFTKKFIEDSKKNFVLLENLETNTKITLLYGLQDSAVKLDTQISLLKLLKTKNAKLTILNNSDHRMSSSLDLNLLAQTIKNMIKGNL